MRLLWVLVFVALGFLFQCGKNNDSSPANVKLSTPEVTFNDVDGAVGTTYTISVSRPPAAEKTVKVTLTSTNSLLVVSPTEVTFTPANYASPQTITVKRANDANNMIMADITDVITHEIATGASRDTEFTEFAMMKSMVNVTVTSTSTPTPTPSNVRLSTPEVTFNDVDGAVGTTYTISVSRPPAAEKTVKVTLTSTNSLLVVSPTEVTFTPANYASPQTITVKRANDANDMIMVDITDVITHEIATGASRDTEFTEFAMMKSMVNVTVRTTFVVDADADGDGLIDISTAEMLNNMQYDLAGTSYKTSAMDAGDSSGCPIGGCNGYELTANIDLLDLLDANGNGQIDKTTVTVANQVHTVIDVGPGKDTSWVPVGDNSTDGDASRFTGTFEGNGHTIANLWVNVSSSSGGSGGLFGVTGGLAEIRNVGVISGGVSSSSSSDDSGSLSGGLVGFSNNILTITNSYFSGSGGVSSSSSGSDSDSFSGGLVGVAIGTLTVTNSYFSGSGGVSTSSSDSSSGSGGLVGFSFSSLTITNSYFSGSGGVSSSSSSDSFSGGLVASSSLSSLTITNSYFSGSGGVSSSSSDSSSGSGGLVGFSSFSSLAITNSYFSGSGGVSSSATTESFSGGLVGSSDATLTITNSYFSGSGGVSSSASSDSFSGGLVGSFSSLFGSPLTITNSYWNTDAPQLINDGMRAQSPKRAQGNVTVDPMGAVGLTLTQLQATSGTFPDLGDAWDLGTDQQNPAVKRCILDMAGMGTCASPAMYGALLNGQR